MKLCPTKKHFSMINNTIFGNPVAKKGSGFNIGKVYKAGISHIEGCRIEQHKDGHWSIRGGYVTRANPTSHRR